MSSTEGRPDPVREAEVAHRQAVDGLVMAVESKCAAETACERLKQEVSRRHEAVVEAARKLSAVKVKQVVGPDGGK